MTDTLFQVACKQIKFWGISNKNVGGAAHTVWWNSLNTKGQSTKCSVQTFLMIYDSSYIKACKLLMNFHSD